MNKKGNEELTLEKIVSLAKRRGFVYPSSEIYGGFSGIYDYGPMGAELAHNLKTLWWQEMVQKKSNIVGLNSAIFSNPKVWVASGHVENFSDPLIECKKCNARLRADALLMEKGIVADEKMDEDEIDKLLSKNKDNIKCPNCGKNDFTSVKKFNLLVESNLGNFSGDKEEVTYLRGETAQGIYVNYKNVVDSMHMKLPFGIAQIGKAFRNEITPRQFLFRTREFDQMEMQYFVRPDDDMKEYEKLKELRMKSLLSLGFKKENLRWAKHENLVFYAKEAYDIEYRYPFGWKEVEGVHARGDYDLLQHEKHSKVNLEYIDPKTNERFIPHIVESSIGVGRLFLALLCDSYCEEEVNGEVRVVLKFKKELSPIKIAVLPLSNKEELKKGALSIFEELKENYMCQYDETQSIGKRYRRQDEIGTPYCITYDFDSIKDKQVTVRNRDQMDQERVAISGLQDYFKEKFK